MRDSDPLRVLLEEAGESAGVPLSILQIERLVAYWLLLVRWNSKVNLTSLLLDPPTPQAVRRLIWEPLLASRWDFGQPAVWFDVGSGCGSPAIPMKVAKPAIPLRMVESRSRKVAFLREAIRATGLEGAEVIHARIEGVPGTVQPRSIGLITMRAVRMAPGVARSIGELVSPKGSVILFGCPVRAPLGPSFVEVVADSGISLLTRASS